MKLLFTLWLLQFILILGHDNLISQNSFEYAPFTPSNDAIYDVFEKGDSLFTLQQNHGPLWSPRIGIHTLSGELINEYHIDSFGIVLMRFIDVAIQNIYLLGVHYTDSCTATIMVFRYDLSDKKLHTMSSLAFCDKNVQNVRLTNGYPHEKFIHGHWVDANGGYSFILRMDTTFRMEWISDTNRFRVLLPEFNQHGYVIKDESFCTFYDSNFTKLHQRQNIMYGSTSNYQSHVLYTNAHILEHFTLLNSDDHPDGMYLRLVDSLLIPRKKLVIFPSTMSAEAITMSEPYFGGLDYLSPDHIWASAMFDFTNNPAIETYFCVTRANSSLEPQCYSYWGYDKRIRLYGMRAARDGGVYLFGWQEKQGGSLDPYLLKLNDMCELIPTGTEPPLTLHHITVYPNPGQDHISFAAHGFALDQLTFELYRSSGELAFHTTDLSHGVQLQHVPEGIYFYQISHKEVPVASGSWVKN